MICSCTLVCNINVYSALTSRYHEPRGQQSRHDIELAYAVSDVLKQKRTQTPLCLELKRVLG